MTDVVKITQKGQATIPKHFRKKFHFKDRAIVEEARDGVLFKPFPEISEEKGSLKELFKEKTAREMLKEARTEDIAREKALELR